jgi:Cof subfamily protein (haloacid dehalogenase superfamily)
MSPVRLLVADVDGTLVTHEKQLTDRARQAVQHLHEARVAFAIVSGRPPRGMERFVAPLALAVPMAAFNGGALVSPDLSILEERCLPGEVVQSIVRMVLGHGLDVWVYRHSEWLLRDPHAPHAEREQRTVGFAPTVTRSFDDVASGVIKIVAVSDDPPALAQVEARLREGLADKVSAARSQPYYLDITHPSANKGTVVRRLSERLAVPREQIATIGDMPNDVMMFTESGLSIAMGNASADVQRAARHVTTTNENEGFATAVDRFVLGGNA